MMSTNDFMVKSLCVLAFGRSKHNDAGKRIEVNKYTNIYYSI